MLEKHMSHLLNKTVARSPCIAIVAEILRTGYRVFPVGAGSLNTHVVNRCPCACDLPVQNSELPVQNLELPIQSTELPIQNSELPRQTSELPIQNSALRKYKYNNLEMRHVVAW